MSCLGRFSVQKICNIEQPTVVPICKTLRFYLLSEFCALFYKAAFLTLFCLRAYVKLICLLFFYGERVLMSSGQCTYKRVYLSIHPFIHLSIRPFTHLSIHSSIHPYCEPTLCQALGTMGCRDEHSMLHFFITERET